MRHGGQILVDQLVIQGCDTVFCVPGESYLAALDGLYATSGIKTIVCRQEGGAAMMADADGKLTGRPGVCFVTRGPGATNASIGVHIARQDSTPMILFVGLPPQSIQDREPFQEFDLTAMFGALAKWTAVIGQTERIPEYVSRAYHVAVSGRPGPVVLGLPEDMLSALCDVDDAKPARCAAPAPAPDDMVMLRSVLEKAERPLVILGGPGWSDTTRVAFEQVAARWDLPVAASFRCQDYFDNAHPNYVGHVGIGVAPDLADAVRGADVLITIGARLGEMTTGTYTLVEVPNPRQFLVHVHPGGDELGSVYRADLPVNAAADPFVEAFARLDPLKRPAWGARRIELRERFEAFRAPVATPGPVKFEQFILTLDDLVGDDAIVTNGAGNYTAWVHRYHLYRRYWTCLAPTAGAMGYGVPAAIAAGLRYPDRQVIAFAGDGCFLMNGQELATAVQYGVKLTVVVVNNGMFGTIRMHQEKTYPERVIATSLSNPDFAALAQAFGAEGEKISQTSELRQALVRALDAPGVSLIEVPLDPQAITPTTTLDKVAGRS